MSQEGAARVSRDERGGESREDARPPSPNLYDLEYYIMICANNRSSCLTSGSRLKPPSYPKPPTRSRWAQQWARS